MSDIETNGGTESAQSLKARPTKILPTNRIAFPKQLDILRAYAAVSGPSRKAVSNDDIENIIKMKASTVSLANAFFVDTGLLQRAERGFIPATEVMEFQRAYEWNPEKASQKLAPVIQGTWFTQALLPKLSFGPISDEEAINDLANVCAATPEYKSQLSLLLDYMQATGLIMNEGGQVRAIKTHSVTATVATQSTTAKEEPAPRSSAVTTAFAQPTEGTVQFHVSVKVDMKEFAGWQADRIAAFFAGIAQVLAAKGQLEKNISDKE